MLNDAETVMTQFATASTDRGPLPPGHPITWGALTVGTVLDGSPYDYRPPYRLLAVLARRDDRASRAA
jgi:hypothetical protein